MNGKLVFTVPSQSCINFKSKFKEKLLCDGLTFTAGTACAYSCSFCFVPAQMRKQTPWLIEHGVTRPHEEAVIRRANAVEIVRKQLTDAKGKPRFSDPNDRRVIYASPLVDVAANMELVAETVEICKLILTLTNWHIRLLSKSNLLPKIAQAIDDFGRESQEGDFHKLNKRVIYGVSTGTLDDKLAQAFEQGCPLVSKRIESLHWLQDNGYRTFSMVCPSLPQPSQAHYLKFAADMKDALRYDRCEHVWSECLNSRGESFKHTFDALWNSGYSPEAVRLQEVSENSEFWDMYCQQTFQAHTAHCPREKLRFMQYVTNATRPWWESQRENGAVVL